MSNRQLIPALERLDSAVIGCAGDLILDRFAYGDVNRVSPEAPIQVLRIASQQSMLGGLGNVARNLGALGCRMRVFAATGEDEPGGEVVALLEQIPRCARACIVREADRQTPVKTRYVAHGQQLLRVDHESTHPVGLVLFRKLAELYAEHIGDCSIVLLSDYAKGLLEGERAGELIRIARQQGKPVIVDPKGADFRRYRGATLIKPNLKELREATGMPVGDTSEQEKAARALIEETGAEYIVVTRGAAGMLLVPSSAAAAVYPAPAHDVYDVSGAGDTVAAMLAAVLGSGGDIAQAVELANIAAGIVVGKVGTAVAARPEILAELERLSAGPGPASEKVLRATQAVERVRLWKRSGLRVGLVYGDFDSLRLEHLELLERVRSTCDKLMVALPAEAGGAAQGRGFLPASLEPVDAVTIAEAGQTVEALIAALGADVVEIWGRG